MTHNNFNCPYCNKQLAVGPSGIAEHSPLTPWEPLTQMQNVAHGPLPGQAGPVHGEWQKITPVGKLSARDVGTTLLDSTIVCGLVSGSVGIICYAAGLPWIVGPITGLFVAGVRYLSGMANTQSLLTVREVWRSNEPEIRPAAAAASRPVITVQIKEGGKFKYAYFMTDARKLVAFAEALLDGAKCTEAEARKHGITQEELKTFREELINRGLAYWNNPGLHRMGITLRHSAYTVLQAIIDSTQQQAAADQED